MIAAGHHEDDSKIVVEYDDEDADMEELLRSNAGSHDLRYEEEDRSDGDEYGGMTHELYNNIVEFKRSGGYPATLNSRQDRSALSHWRARCMRFLLAQDNETLLYFNAVSNTSEGLEKVVVKKGEVRRVIERVHELIGHLGQKRTQMAVLKKLHWRSVRQDVKTYILNCAFCNQKKLEGKKILKAPVDISSESFGIEVTVRGGDVDGDRLHLSLIGSSYNEHEVHAAAMTRMTSYTFKETANELRGRFGRTHKPEFLAPGSSTAFRRQPYIRRSRYNPYPTSYILPYTPKGPKEDPEFIIFPDPRGQQGSYATETEEYEVEESLVEDSRPGPSGEIDGEELVEHIPNEEVNPQDEHPMQGGVVKEEGMMGMYAALPTGKRIGGPRMAAARKRTRLTRNPNSSVSRFSAVVGENDRMDIAEHSAELLSPLEGVQSRPELLGLAPIMMMPSVDREVIALQKELLTRQLRIQDMQEKLLQSHFESTMHIPIARYEEMDPRGERMQILQENEDGVMEDHLNVIDSGDEDDMGVINMN